MPDVRKVLVEGSHTCAIKAPTGEVIDLAGVAIGVGQLVDLDAEIAPGVTYRDAFDEATYFEPALPPPPPPAADDAGE